MHLLSNVLVSKEKPNAEVFGGDVLTIPNDELANTSEHDIFDGLCCDPAQVRYEDRSISHPAIRRQINVVVSYIASRSCEVKGKTDLCWASNPHKRIWRSYSAASS
jgi:hypothetical protein